MEGPESHQHGHHATGVRWVDLSLALAALFTSVISLWLALQHGHDMERLVQANSLPYLQIYSSDMEEDRKTPAFRITVQNQGVGPARIAEVSVKVDGKPVANFNQLVDRCCAPGLLAAAKQGAESFAGIESREVILSTLRDRMVRQGETVDSIDWRETPGNRAVLGRFKDALRHGRVTMSLCYCSVFDECWTRSLADRRPQPVRSCPADTTPYVQ